MKTLFVVFSFIICTACISQEIRFEQKIGWKGGGSFLPISLHTFHNADKSLTCVTIICFDSLKAFLMDKDMKLIQTTNLTLVPNNKFLGGFISDNKISFLFDRPKDRQIANWVYNVESNSYDNYLLPFDLKGKKILGHTGVGKFYYITAEKKEPVINVFEITTEGRILQHDYDLFTSGAQFDKTYMWQTLSKSSGGIGRDIDVAFVEPEADCSIEAANEPNKIYYRNDTLLLLTDKENGRTHIFSFDLLHNKLAYRKIERAGMTAKMDEFSNQCVFNSFLLEDKLYYIYATDQSLSVTVNDFFNGRELKRFSAARDEEITFKNTPILQEGGGTIYSAGSKRELEKTKQFLNKLMSGRAVITAYKNQYNQYEITVGAYKEMRSSGGGFSSFGGSAPVYSVGVSKSWERVTRFKSLLDSKTLEHVADEIKPSISEILETYKKGIKIPAEGESLFAVNHNFYYTYYDREKKEIIVVKL